MTNSSNLRISVSAPGKFYFCRVDTLGEKCVIEYYSGLHIGVMGKLPARTAITCCKHGFICCLEALVHFDTYVSIEFNASVLEPHPFYIWLTAACKENCININYTFFTLMIKNNLNSWKDAFRISFTYLLEKFWDSTEKEFYSVFFKLSHQHRCCIFVFSWQ